jgi:hypothetical protein
VKNELHGKKITFSQMLHSRLNVVVNNEKLANHVCIAEQVAFSMGKYTFSPP